MATFQEMQDRVYAVLRDSERAYVALADVKNWLNEAYLELNARLGLLRKAATGTTSASGTITLPSDFIYQTYFTVASDTPGVLATPEFVRDDIFQSYKAFGSTPSKTLARIFNGVIETYPAVVSKAYTLEYVYKPTALSANGDIAALPEELHVKLINYARYHAKLQEGEIPEAREYQALYLDGLPPTSPDALRRELRPARIDFIPEPTYWDAVTQDDWSGDV